MCYTEIKVLRERIEELQAVSKKLWTNEEVLELLLSHHRISKVSPIIHGETDEELKKYFYKYKAKK